MTEVLVLGAGMVGSVIAADLAATRTMRVTIADRSADALAAAARRSTRNALRCVRCDCADADEVLKLAAGAEVIVGALPSRLGFATLKALAARRVKYCDISFMPEDFLALDRVAKRSGAVCVADCGVAPGMSNLLAGWGVHRLERADRVDIMVGGVPRHRHWPFEYKAGFSPFDVIEEYVRPSRVVERGKVVIKEALSEPERVEFDGVGTLEAFNTDGLRSLARTLKVPEMRERTLRYPGHIELMRVFRETGLFSLDEIEVGAARVRPRDVLAALLFPKWTYEEGEEDLTVMRVTVEGTLDGVPTRLVWDLLDRRDPESGFSSMARTTAFPATSVARMLADGTIRAPGVHAPERLAPAKGVLDRMLAEMAERGVRYHAKVERDVHAMPASKRKRAPKRRRAVHA